MKEEDNDILFEPDFLLPEAWKEKSLFFLSE